MLNWLNGLEKKDKEFDAVQQPSQKNQREEDTAEPLMCENGMRKWWAGWNTHSIDGLPALEYAATQRVVPLGGNMPDPVEAGMRVREPRKPELNVDKSKAELNHSGNADVSSRACREGNVKFVVGIVLGSLLTFLLKETVQFVKKVLIVHV